jgi:hypothetical protein
LKDSISVKLFLIDLGENKVSDSINKLKKEENQFPMKTVKKIFLVAISVSLCFFSLSNVQAQVLDQNGREISRPTVLPGSPFYFLKNIGREIQTFFATDAIRADLRLDFASQKLVELQKLIKSNNSKNITESLNSYVEATETMREAASSLGKANRDNTEFLDNLIEQVFIHQQILAQFDNSINSKKLEAVKNKSLENFTVSIYSVATPEVITQKIEANIKSNPTLKDFKMQVLNGMYNNSPTDYRNYILTIQTDLLNQ